MQDRIIKKWHPIIEKLDATNSLSHEQKLLLYNYCENYSRREIHWHSTGTTLGHIPPGTYRQYEESSIVMMLKVVYSVMLELLGHGITLAISDEDEPEPQMHIENNVVTVKLDSDFVSMCSSVKIPDIKVKHIHDLGLDEHALLHKALSTQAIMDLTGLGIRDGELTIHTTGSSLQMYTTPDMYKSLVLTYKVKNVQK